MTPLKAFQIPLPDTSPSFGRQDRKLQVGKDFEALVVQTETDGVMTMLEEKDSLEIIFEKFLISGDDRNIAQVYVKGRQLKGSV